MSEPETRREPTADEARESLAYVERLRAAGVARGVHPRWLAAATSLWAGTIAALVGFDGPRANGAIVLLALVGIAGLSWRRQHVGVWPREVGTSRDLAAALYGVLVLVLVALGGAVAREAWNSGWPPIAAGALAALFLFGLMELGRRSMRARLAGPDA